MFFNCDGKLVNLTHVECVELESHKNAAGETVHSTILYQARYDARLTFPGRTLYDKLVTSLGIELGR